MEMFDSNRRLRRHCTKTKMEQGIDGAQRATYTINIAVRLVEVVRSVEDVFALISSPEK